MKLRHCFAALACLLPLTAIAADTATPPRPFTAAYEVLRGGAPLGTSTLTLTRNADGTWSYRSSLEATHGLAAMLGGSIKETSRFRWHDDRIEAVDYDYHMHLSVKDRSRHVAVDWTKGTVNVNEGKHAFSYKAVPGLVERHILVLALGRAVAAGKTQMTLPVAVKDRVQTQTFASEGTQSVTVPAGTLQAVKVVRTHDSKGYTAWFDPSRCGAAPVKLAQQSGGDITLLLKSCTLDK